MGIQCHTKLVHVVKHALNVQIKTFFHDTGDGPNQDQPWTEKYVEVLLPSGALLTFNLNDDLSMWFDANEWGDNRWQVEEMRKVGIPYLES